MPLFNSYSKATFADLWSAAPDLITAEPNPLRQDSIRGPRQTAALAKARYDNVRVGSLFFDGCDEENSWWNTPRELLPGRYINALVTAITGELRDFTYCSGCATQELEDLFFGACIADLGDEFTGCANCIHGNVGEACDFCDFAKPVFVCLEQHCEQRGPGHEHILRGWLDDSYKNSIGAAASALFLCEWTNGIYLVYQNTGTEFSWRGVP
ncbi:hypothetical protein QBC47DRAFT_462066 [Echria macrotheca]|uniref:Uncharacterized protein n=1 Tax=Echria macrotheca TaxID=438768 RepID=A0AAJ0B9E3_9PEZI|nr:hypothetical protein QBC47DRAFT_462066 [Echria macrotheca]